MQPLEMAFWCDVLATVLLLRDRSRRAIGRKFVAWVDMMSSHVITSSTHAGDYVTVRRRAWARLNSAVHAYLALARRQAAGALLATWMNACSCSRRENVDTTGTKE